MPASRRFVPTVLVMCMLTACSGGGQGFGPPQQRASSAAKTTQATFTIKWTNPSAPASVRRKDTISPSAQSIAISINGSLSTIANRNGSPSQSITLIAPVGNDQFLFNVYDGPNGGGHLLGTATVSQLIVDGAANNVTASIQAVCAVTNVQVANNDSFAHLAFGATGIYASTLQSMVLVGQSPETLIVGPEDVDGNIIIAGTGGTVSYQITGSATVTPIDGAHLKLTPTSGFRSTTPDTLTLAAPTCPTTTVAVQHSPALYVENTGNQVFVVDWYGDNLGGGVLASGDVLIGYDTHSQSMMTYNPGTGQVNAYAPSLQSHTAKYTILTGMIACWSNYLGAVFAVRPTNEGGGTYYMYVYSFANPASPYAFGAASTTGAQASVACSTMSNTPNAFMADSSGIYEFSLATNVNTSAFSASTVVSMATDDRNGVLYAFNSSGSYVSQFSQSGLSSPYTGNYAFPVAPAVGGSDTDGDDVYAILTNTGFYASSYQGTAFSNFGYGVGTGLAIEVLSTNEQ
jgi:hypothetical protein